MNDNSIIKDIGRSYIVSSFIPAALFVMLGTLIFRDFIPYFFQIHFFSNEVLYAGQFVLAITFITWMGFGLYSGWNWTVRFYEGYYFGKYLSKILRKPLEWEYKRNSKIYRRFKKKQKKTDGKELTSEEEDLLIKLHQEAESEVQQLGISGPLVKDHLLPTRLGNVLLASELYAKERYHLEGVTAWPRLTRIFPKDFNDQLEETNNKFIFLLNSSLLSLCIGMLSLGVWFLHLPCSFDLITTQFFRNFLVLNTYYGFACTSGKAPGNFFQNGFLSTPASTFFWIGAILLLGSYFIYRVAVIAAQGYGLLIRTGFDMHRLDLLKQFRQEVPKNIKEERLIWESISEFLIAGDALGDFQLNFVPSPKSENEVISNPTGLPVSNPDVTNINLTYASEPKKFWRRVIKSFIKQIRRKLK